MAEQQYRLIALDVDGTLLDPAHMLTPRTRAALWSAQRRGARVCLATGKLLASVRPLLTELALGGLHITCNGAALMDAATGEAIAAWPLSDVQIALALATIRECAPEMGVAWYTTNAIYTDAPPDGPLDVTLGANLEPALRHVARLAADALPPPLKFLMTGDHASLLALRDGLLERIGATLTVTRTTSDFVEVMAPGVSKGHALGELIARLGVPREAVIAFGDGENDIPLLDAAGLGVAMGNAMPALLPHAKRTTLSNAADGVAVALEELGLADSES
jgi:Cof subfamily protein (haloacid dehalogenase superfamily)